MILESVNLMLLIKAIYIYAESYQPYIIHKSYME